MPSQTIAVKYLLLSLTLAAASCASDTNKNGKVKAGTYKMTLAKSSATNCDALEIPMPSDGASWELAVSGSTGIIVTAEAYDNPMKGNLDEKNSPSFHVLARLPKTFNYVNKDNYDCSKPPACVFVPDHSYTSMDIVETYTLETTKSGFSGTLKSKATTTLVHNSDDTPGSKCTLAAKVVGVAE